MSPKVKDETMKGEEKRGLVPRLRFPEFRGTGEWKETRLGAVLTFQAGFPFDSASFTEECKGIRLIRNRDLKSDDKVIFYSSSFDKNYVVNDGDVLVGMDGDFSPCVWNKGKALLNQRVGKIIPHKGASQRFMYYFLTVHLKAIEEATARTTVKHLSHSDVERICEPAPTFSEQQRIADCLSSIDELITAEAQYLDTLKTHKKGLMQQLFPEEGETVPRLRFPEFRGAGEWEAKKLFEECYVNPSNESLPETFAYIDLESVVSGKLIIKKNISRDNAPSRAQRLLKNGDVIYQIVRPYQRNNFYCNLSDSNHHVASTGYAQLRSFNNSKFLYQLVHTDDFVNKVITKCTGSNYPAINSSDLAEIGVVTPKLTEQQKIADCLSSLDDLIALEAQHLDTLKIHKKGLMQQLFPRLDEVQG